MLIQYHNDLNTVSFKPFTLVENRLFFALTYYLFDKRTAVVDVPLKELKKMTKYGYTYEKLFSDLYVLRDKTHRLSFHGEPFVFFDTFIVDPENKTLHVSVTDRFMYMLNPFEAFMRQFSDVEDPERFFELFERLINGQSIDFEK